MKMESKINRTKIKKPHLERWGFYIMPAIT